MARDVVPQGASGPLASPGPASFAPGAGAAPAADPPGGDPAVITEPAGLADEDLRPALELGFAVALVLSRQRPAQPVPAALRPYLRFQKLPTAALGPLRRVLANDPDFRERTATVADEAIIGRASWLWLVRPDGWQDELARSVGDGVSGGDRRAASTTGGQPAGAGEADADAGADAADAADAAGAGPVRRPVRRAAAASNDATAVTDRKLAKRLEAAEQALVRARLDADEVRIELQLLRARRDDDAAAVPKLTAKVAQLETELRGARRRLDEQQQGAASASVHAAQVAHDLAEARGAAARAEAERDEAVADAAEHRARFTRLVGRVADLDIAAPGASAATEAPGALATPGAPAAAGPSTGATVDAGAGAVLREVAGATRRLGEVLDQLAGALGGRAPVDVGRGSFGQPDRTGGFLPSPDDAEPTVERRRSARPAPTRRRPMPLPGGVLVDSALATEHLLRKSALVLVDGYNVAKLGWPSVDLAEQRTRLLGVLDEVGARFGADLRVVFDGSEITGPAATTGARRRVPVTFSPPGVPADDVLVELVRAQPADQHVVVVTNDQELRARVRELGGNLIRSDQLLAIARR